jgi:hypothetical protein
MARLASKWTSQRINGRETGADRARSAAHSAAAADLAWQVGVLDRIPVVDRVPELRYDDTGKLLEVTRPA